MFFILNAFYCVSQSDTVTVFTIVEEPAEYPGGISAMYKFIAGNLKHIESNEDAIHCRTYIKFIINEEGIVTDPFVFKSCNGCSPCDDEALRVVKMFPKWKPAKMSGRIVKSYFLLPIKFGIGH